jgi:hypothetical protein
MDNVVLFCQTSSGKDHFNGSPSYGIKRGWKDFADRIMHPSADMYEDRTGDKLRFLLHLPFGFYKSAAQPNMALGAVHESHSKGLTYRYEEFHEAIEPITMAGHEVIAYLGAPHNTSPDPNDYLDITFALQAGCSIALDNSASLNRTVETDDLLTILESTGVRTYREATPERDNRNYPIWNSNFIIWQKLARQRHGANQHPGVVNKYPRYDADDYYQAPSEIVGLIKWGDAKSTSGQLAIADQLIAIGMTPAFTIGGFSAVIDQL